MSQHSSIPFNPHLQDIDKAYKILVVTTMLAVLVILSTLRIAPKLSNKIRLAADDYFILLSLVFNLINDGIEHRCVKSGSGRHLQFLTTDQERSFWMWSQFSILFACLALWAVKISISFFILAIIQGTHRLFRRVTYTLIAITTLGSFLQLLLWGLQARPLKKLWKPEVPGTIADRQQLVISLYTFSSIFMITDLFYSLAPIYFLARVQMSLHRKFGILILTGSGLIVVAVSILRLARYTKDSFRPDASWSLVPLWICTIVERHLAAIIANLPTLLPLVRGLRNNMTRFSSKSTSPSSTKKSNTFVTSHSSAPSNPSFNRLGNYGEHDAFASAGSAHHEDLSSHFGQYGILSEDEIPLRDRPERPKSALSREDVKHIRVETDINVHSSLG